MKVVTKNLYIYLIFLLAGKVYSQNLTPTQVLPPSPNASELGRYGDIPVGLSTGTLNLNIPLMEYGTKNLKLPISLNYSSNGFRVNAYSSRVGLDWVLNSGGVITRTVYDKDDFLSQRLTAPNFNLQDDALLNYLETSTVGGADNQPDVFRYNFAGYVGKFILDNAGVPRCIPINNLKIEYSFGTTTSFIITTPDGIKYFFGGINATESSKVSSNSDCGGAGHVAGTDGFVDNSWYLNKVEHPFGDVINLSYQKETIFYRSSVSETLAHNVNTIIGKCEDCATYTDNICYTTLEVNVVRLSEINGLYGKVNFMYKNEGEIEGLLDYIIFFDEAGNRLKKVKMGHQNVLSNKYPSLYTTSEDENRTFLSTINEYGSSDINPKVHRFFYKDLDNLPVRFSYAQDYEGFYNGKYNYHLVPLPEDIATRILFNNKGGNREPDSNFSQKGLIEKVVYPTGGESQFVFEGHDVFTTETTASGSMSSTCNVLGTDESYFNLEEYVVDSKSITINENQNARLEIGFHHFDSITDGDNHIKLIVELVNSATDEVVSYHEVSQNQNKTVYVGLQKNVTYQLNIKLFGYEGFYGFATLQYTTAGEEISHNREYPGVRISKLIKRTNEFAVPEVKTYRYSYVNDLSKSSGKTNRPKAVYFGEFDSRFFCTENSSNVVVLNIFNCKYYFLYSNSINAGGISAESFISYASVLESDGEEFYNGGTEYLYSHSTDFAGLQLMGKHLLDVPFENYAWNSGRLLEENTFRIVNGNIIYNKKIKNQYKIDDRVFYKVPGYGIKKNYEVKNVWLTSPPSVVFFEPFDVTVYNLNCYWDYIEKTEISDFDETGDNPIKNTITYFYDNPLHMMCTRMESISSVTGINTLINIKYPHEMIAENKDPQGTYASMINRNMISNVIEKQRNKNSVKIYSLKNSYINPVGNLYVLGGVSEWNSSKNEDEEIYSYKHYDIKGNIRQISYRNLMNTTYLYSYKNDLPIAEIKNADYSIIASVLGGESAIDAFSLKIPTDQEVYNFITQLRNSSLLKNSLITTYTYKPLIGVTSMTDAKGMTIYYEYDSFGRLKLEKDQYGNVIKNYSYHYKP